MGALLQSKESIINRIITLRLLVGYLGEKDQLNWWDTLFLSATGLEFLKINFPRTALSSGINSVSEAAKRIHDKYIGIGRVYHLFRLPSDLEEDIHFNLLHKTTNDLDEIANSIRNRETALAALLQVAGESVKSPEGPVLIGKSKDLIRGPLIVEIARCYAEAFTKGKRVYPYFTE